MGQVRSIKFLVIGTVRAFDEGVELFLSGRDIKQRDTEVLEDKVLHKGSFSGICRATELLTVVCLEEEAVFYTESAQPVGEEEEEG